VARGLTDPRHNSQKEFVLPAPKFITFDCYGTLTRFRITEMVREMLADRVPAERIDTFIADYSNYRIDEVLGAWKPYAEVIKNGLERTCRKHGVAFVAAEGQRIYDAVPTWGPHADVAAPLTRIGERIPLVILSNASNDQIDRNVEKLEAKFHAVFTAEQAQSYKPRMRGFEYMLDSLGAKPEECMHVSSSLRYDHMTAHDLGYKQRVLVERGHGPALTSYITDQVSGIDGLAALLGI
jgi:2-haloacid dehalogenase